MSAPAAPERTILLSLCDVLLVDEASHTAVETTRLRFARTRIFVLSILLGLSLGVTLSVMEPERSMDISMRARGWIRTGIADLTTAFQAP
jgi:hypothetical protein